MECVDLFDSPEVGASTLSQPEPHVAINTQVQISALLRPIQTVLCQLSTDGTAGWGAMLSDWCVTLVPSQFLRIDPFEVKQWFWFRMIDTG